MSYKINSSFGNGNFEALSTMRKIDKITPELKEKNCFDFTGFYENNPFNVLAIAVFLKEYRKRYSQYDFCVRPRKNNDFLSHLGFYKMLGVNFGKSVGEARPTQNFVPITKIHFSGDFYSDIEEKAKNLARLLNFDPSLEAFLIYAFVETIRNAYEHAKTDRVYVCAQKWPRYDLVEIAIADAGCGVSEALGKRFPNKNEDELLRLSLEPGISACSNFYYLEKDDAWRNSGYGLYALKELAVLYDGSFLLCSGKKAILCSSNGIREFETAFPGTALYIRIKTNTNNDFKKMRSAVIAKGERLAKETDKAIKRASKSSGGSYN